MYSVPYNSSSHVSSPDSEGWHVSVPVFKLYTLSVCTSQSRSGGETSPPQTGLPNVRHQQEGVTITAGGGWVMVERGRVKCIPHKREFLFNTCTN